MNCGNAEALEDELVVLHGVDVDGGADGGADDDGATPLEDCASDGESHASDGESHASDVESYASDGGNYASDAESYVLDEVSSSSVATLEEKQPLAENAVLEGGLEAG